MWHPWVINVMRYARSFHIQRDMNYLMKAAMIFKRLSVLVSGRKQRSKFAVAPLSEAEHILPEKESTSSRRIL